MPTPRKINALDAAAVAQEPLLTIGDVALWLQVSVETVRWWRATNVGPVAVKVGRHLRYRARDVEAWIDASADAA